MVVATPGILEIVRQVRLPGLLAGLMAAGAAALAVLWPLVIPQLLNGRVPRGTRRGTLPEGPRAGRGAAALRERLCAGRAVAVLREGLRAVPWFAVAGSAGVFLLGVGLFLAAMTLGQLPLLQALSGWQARVLPEAHPLVLGILPALTAGLVQEPVKLAGVLAAVLAGTRAAPPPAQKVTSARGAGVTGALVGAGFAAAETTWVLSVAFTTVSAYQEAGVFSLGVPVLVQMVMSFYHAGSSTALGRAWLRSPASAFRLVGILIGLHAFLAYLRVLAGTGSLGPWASSLLAVTVALGVVGYGLVTGVPRLRPAPSLLLAGEP